MIPEPWLWTAALLITLLLTFTWLTEREEYKQLHREAERRRLLQTRPDHNHRNPTGAG